MRTEAIQRGAVSVWPRRGFLARRAERGVKERLAAIREGRITLREGPELSVFGRPTPAFPHSAVVEVKDPTFYEDIAFGGTIGAAEAYMLGKWDADDLTAVIRVLVRNSDVGNSLEGGSARLRRLLLKSIHTWRRNTLRGSRKNISAHYDLGNEFFETFLDPTMMYSSAIFPSQDASLEEASRNKLETICRKLQLKPGDRVVEIGTGWGGFALHAAGRFGCHVTTTTISEEQFRYARQRVQAEGLADMVTVLDRDYRALPPEHAHSFDHLVSIEMIEAVGATYLDAYFRACCDLLKPTGSMLLQSIVIADQLHDAYRRSVDFIQKYIFPGGSLPSVTSICSSMTRASDLRLFGMEDFTPHYARTLRHWRERFLHKRQELAAMGLGDRFQRMWEYYFCYCEGGFLERNIGVVQMKLVRPGFRSVASERDRGARWN